MRALPHLQVVDKRNGVAQYAVKSKLGWLSPTWLDVLLLAWFLFMYLDNREVRKSALFIILFPNVLPFLLAYRQKYRKLELSYGPVGDSQMPDA
jgi:hypothetical protein